MLVIFIFICSTYNFAGKLYNRLFTAYESKDTEGAKLEQRRSQAMIKVYVKHGTYVIPALCHACTIRDIASVSFKGRRLLPPPPPPIKKIYIYLFVGPCARMTCKFVKRSIFFPSLRTKKHFPPSLRTIHYYLT